MQDKKFTVDWFSGMIPKFNGMLSRFLGKEDVHFLEIGSYEGMSSSYFFENFINGSKFSTMTCIDTWEGSMEHDDSQKVDLWERFNSNTSIYDREKFLVKRGMSRHVLKTLNENSYDFIYIDGSHTTKDVLVDGVLCYDLLKVGGIMTFDDYLWTHYSDPILNPKIGVDCFLTSFSDRVQVIDNGYQISVIKIK